MITKLGNTSTHCVERGQELSGAPNCVFNTTTMEHEQPTSTDNTKTLIPFTADVPFPINLKVTHGDNPSPNITAFGRRSGDIYIGPATIYIIQSSKWTPWNPTTPLLLDFDGDELYTSPCADLGLRLVDSEEESADRVASMRRDLKLGDQDDLTAAVIQRICTAAQTDVQMAGVSFGQVCTICAVPYGRLTTYQEQIPTATLPSVETPEGDRRPGGRRDAPQDRKADAKGKAKVRQAPERVVGAVNAEGVAGKVAEIDGKTAKGSEGRKRKVQHGADAANTATGGQHDSLHVAQDRALPKRRRGKSYSIDERTQPYTLYQLHLQCNAF